MLWPAVSFKILYRLDENTKKKEIGPRDIVTSLQLMSLLPLEILRVQPSAVAWSFKILYCWDEKQKNEIVPSPHLMSLLPLKITSATQRCRSLLSSDPRPSSTCRSK